MSAKCEPPVATDVQLTGAHGPTSRTPTGLNSGAEREGRRSEVPGFAGDRPELLQPDERGDQTPPNALGEQSAT